MKWNGFAGRRKGQGREVPSLFLSFVSFMAGAAALFPFLLMMLR